MFTGSKSRGSIVNYQNTQKWIYVVMRKKTYSEEELIAINTLRNHKYQLNVEDEMFLREMNSCLSAFEERQTSNYQEPKKPVVFIVGLPRSGSSLLYQRLASTNMFSYFNNFTARFWRAPYVGFRLAQILEIVDDRSLSFTSDYGKTGDGLHSPHECMFFWDRWFARGQVEQEVSKDKWSEIDGKALKQELAAIERVLEKPLLLKSQFWLTLQIDYLKEIFPNSIYVSTWRNPLYVGQSIAMARKQIHGDLNSWWSVKPKEYDSIKGLGWADQVMGQVYFTERKMQRSMKSLKENRIVESNYFDLCSSPSTCLDALSEKLRSLGEDVDMDVGRQDSFPNADRQKLDDDEFKVLIESYRKYYHEDPSI